MNLLEVEQGLTLNRPPIEAPATIVEFMPEGYAIEKNPMPVATMVIPASPTESILLASPQLSPQPETDTAVLGEDRDAVAALILNSNVIRPIDGSVAEESASSLSEESPNAPEKNGLGKNMLLAARRSKLGIFAATAAVTAVGLLSANTETAKAEPVSPVDGNVPTLVNNAAFSGAAEASLAGTAGPETLETPGYSSEDSLEQACIDAGLTMPEVYARMRFPGKHNQTLITKATYEDMPTECDGLYQRSAKIKFQLQDHKNHNRWFTMTRPKWLILLYGQGGNQGTTVGPSIMPSGHEGNWIYFQKTKGPGQTHAREFIKNIVKNDSGNIVGERTEQVPIQISLPARKK